MHEIGPSISEQQRRNFANARIVVESGEKGFGQLRRQFSQPLLVLMAVVTLVLLIACLNVANLLPAPAASRRQEISMRLSPLLVACALFVRTLMNPAPDARLRSDEPDRAPPRSVAGRPRRRLAGTSDPRAVAPLRGANETMAQFCFPGRNPIGRRIHAVSRNVWLEVVGVARDVQDHDVREKPPRRFYFCYLQPIDGIVAANFQIRAAGDMGRSCSARFAGDRDPRRGRECGRLGSRTGPRPVRRKPPLRSRAAGSRDAGSGGGAAARRRPSCRLSAGAARIDPIVALRTE